MRGLVILLEQERSKISKMKSHIGDLDRELKEVKHQRDSVKSDFSDISEMYNSLSFEAKAKLE